MVGIIRRPVLTEKVTALQDRRQYAFEVELNANKIDIAHAIEKKFGVTVLNVRTLRMKGKLKTQLTRGGRFQGRTRMWKKALVTLKEGDKIDYLENV